MLLVVYINTFAIVGHDFVRMLACKVYHLYCLQEGCAITTKPYVAGASIMCSNFYM